jgi:hypothetical protein
VFWMGIYYINRLIARGPVAVEPRGLPSRPLSAARHPEAGEAPASRR